jgi:hypothetical protein
MTLRRASAGVTLLISTAFANAAPYRPYTDVETALANAEAAYPSICKRVNLGQTLQGRTMWALCITDNVNVQEDEPEVLYISTMHGDEPVGTENLLNLVTLLTTNYNVDSRLTAIVNNVELWIVPVMNPDGYTASTRGNANGVDLNRDFPDPYTSPVNTPAGRQIETANIMNWRFGLSTTLSANFHTGELVVNYPFDANPNGLNVFTPTPDEDLFVFISEKYSQTNLPMWNTPDFFHGITNGADWYHVNGGMQDWAYVYQGCNEVTIELNKVKTPPAGQLPQLWNDNRESLLAYIEQSLIGARGLVTSFESGQPLPATVSVVGRAHNTYTDPDIGDYHRMLLPGTYILRFDAAGKESRQIANVAVNAGPATVLNVVLSGPPVVTFPNGGESLPVGAPATITWTGNPAAQFHVQYTLDANSQSVTNDGFESPVFDPAYTTGGAAAWFMVNVPVHSGARSARAGIIADGQQSWLKRSVVGPAIANFWYRVSSQAGHDYFRFYVDGVQRLEASGTIAFTQFDVGFIPSGSHELKWEYAKDATSSTGADTVWIDDLSIAVDNAAWADVIALTPVGATSTGWTPTSASNQAKVRVRAFYDGTLYGNWDYSNANFAIVPGPTLGDLDCNGIVNAGDVNPFVTALVDPAGYAASYPGCAISRGDTNTDSFVNGDDIEPFLVILLGG